MKAWGYCDLKDKSYIGKLDFILNWQKKYDVKNWQWHRVCKLWCHNHFADLWATWSNQDSGCMVYNFWIFINNNLVTKTQLLYYYSEQRYYFSKNANGVRKKRKKMLISGKLGGPDTGRYIFWSYIRVCQYKFQVFSIILTNFRWVEG